MARSTAPAHDAPLASPVANAGLTRSGGVRIDAIDLLRGLVIVVMVLDHVRDFFHVAAFTADPMALDSGDPGLFLTRWITQFCAPTFVFLAGLSIWMQKAGGKAPGDLSRFLLTRGLWLIVLELAVVGIGFNFGWWIFLQVIWAIGVGMIVMAAMSRLPRLWVLGLGVVVVGGHAVLGQVPAEAFGPLEPLWRALAARGPVPTPAGLMLVAYPAIPWVGIMLLGYGLGGVLTGRSGLRVGRTAVTGLTMLGLFLIGRGLNVPGFDPNPWSVQPDPLWSAFSFVSTFKYPPSPAYVLMTVGAALLMLAAFTRLKGPVAGVLLTFGRTPLLTYLLHIYIAHGLAVVVGMAMGLPPGAFFGMLLDPSRLMEAGWGFGLPGVYAAWLAVLVLMWPLSRWFEGVKRRRRDWWLGYL